MVKLQKRFAYKYKTKNGETKTHYKYIVNIPQEFIDELNWNDGDELRLLSVGGILQLKSERK